MKNHISLVFLQTMLYNHEQLLYSMKYLNIDMGKQVVEVERIKNIKCDIKAVKSNKRSKDD
ncbi:hypothetical protein BTM165_16610 [Helicobacter pylori]